MPNSLFHILQKHAQSQPKEWAVIRDGEAFTYKDFYEKVLACIEQLEFFDVREGEVVGISSVDPLDTLLHLFAATKINFVIAPIDPSIGKKSFNKILENVPFHHLFVDTQFIQNYLQEPKTASPSSQKNLIRIDPELFSSQFKKPTTPLFLKQNFSSPLEQPLILLSTSGSTNSEKYIVHNQKSLLIKLEKIESYFRWDKSLKTLCLLPIQFGHALYSQALASLFVGGKLVLFSQFSPSNLDLLWETVRAEKINHFSVVPSALKVLLRFTKNHFTKNISFITCASAHLTKELAQLTFDKLGLKVVNCFGATETLSWFGATPLDAPPSEVGFQIFDHILYRPIHGDPYSCELELSGPILFSGCFKNHKYIERPQEAWWSPKDIFEIKNEKIYFKGRVDQMIVRNGFKVNPQDIVEVFDVLPEVEDVCCYGETHPLRGEKVIALIQLQSHHSLQTKDLFKSCQETLSPSQWPDEIRIVAKIHRSSRGKISFSEI